MKRLYWFVFLVACGNSSSSPPKDEPPAAVNAEYKADLEAICDVVERSGATTLEGNERAMTTATWLGTNLKTQEARKFLSKLRQVKGAEKGDVLDAEAIRVGMSGCPLAAEWRKPRP